MSLVVVGLLGGVYAGALFREKYKPPSLDLFQEALGKFKIEDEATPESSQ